MATEFTDQTFLAGVEKQPGATMSAPESGEKSLDSEPGRARGSRPARDRGRQGGGRGGHEGRKKRKEAGRTEWRCERHATPSSSFGLINKVVM